MFEENHFRPRRRRSERRRRDPSRSDGIRPSAERADSRKEEHVLARRRSHPRLTPGPLLCASDESFSCSPEEKVPKEKGAPRLGRCAAPLRSSERALREAEEGPVAQRWDPTLGGAQGLAIFGALISPAGGCIPSSAPRARLRNSTFALRATGFAQCSLVPRLSCGARRRQGVELPNKREHSPGWRSCFGLIWSERVVDPATFRV
jgi:hypothetical protein